MDMAISYSDIYKFCEKQDKPPWIPNFQPKPVGPSQILSPVT